MKGRLQAIRSEQALETGQTIITALIREPVREAVREALVEERRRDAGAADPPESDATDDGTTLLTPKVALPILGLAALGLYLRRRERSSFATAEDDAEEGAASTATSSTTAGRDALVAPHEGGSTETDEEQRDGEPTASS